MYIIQFYNSVNMWFYDFKLIIKISGLKWVGFWPFQLWLWALFWKVTNHDLGASVLRARAGLCHIMLHTLTYTSTQSRSTLMKCRQRHCQDMQCFHVTCDLVKTHCDDCSYPQILCHIQVSVHACSAVFV